MNVLIYGSSGWIGSQFVDILKQNKIDFVCGKARVEKEDELVSEITTVEPTHIVSFIGRTHGKIGSKVYTTIDYLEEEGKLYENVRDNLFSPLLLADICSKKGIHFSYLGTGCIFKFDEEHPFGKEENGFTEDSLPNFFGSSYSVVKGFTDRLMKLYSDNVLNLRIRMPITGEKNSRNFITKIANYERICSVPNSMTVLPELLPFVLDMMKKGVVGTVNLTNPGLISHNEILQMYKEIVDHSFVWKNFSQEEQRAILAADRSNNFLETTKLESLYPHVKNIKDSIRECLIQYKQTLKEEVNLLVTGGCGFIGSNFINYFFPKGKVHKLVNLDAMYYCANENNVTEQIRNNNNYVLIKGNLCDEDLVKQTLVSNQITHVIHFAAQSHVQNSFEDSLTFTKDNVLGTHVLLESCRKYGKIKKFIHVSTDEVYGESMNNVDEQHKTEHSVLCPTNPYAATKAGAELVAQSYNHSYKMPIIITRGNNVYGPNQYPEKLIPRFIKLLKEGKKVTIQGEGKSVRAFLHAYDTAKAFECILEKGQIGEIYNIGCDEGMEYSVIDVAKILIRMIKGVNANYDDWIEYIEDRPFNDQRYYISNQKLKDLGWNIEIELLDGLKQLQNTELYNVFVYCSGKTGSSTLNKTFIENGYTSIHIHCNENYQIHYNKQNTIFEVIDSSCKYYENVYIIDSYRTPIERSISSFFSNISVYLPKFYEFSVEELIAFFNNNFFYYLENYHPNNEVLTHYNIPLFDSFNFEKGYNIIKRDNKTFIKVLFKDLTKWKTILSEIFGKQITLYSDNLTENKEEYNLYKQFKELYKIPKDYINNVLINDREFKIYNTEEEQKDYIQKWLEKSY